VSSTEVGVKRVYDFSEGSRDMRDLLGGKGANVAEMTRLGLPVPKGFTITTETCIEYLANDHRFPEGLDREISEHLAALEEAVGTRLGDARNPLLVSVRSGAKFSMPGMMDTVLNLGLNDESVEGLAERTGNPRFAYDSYRRFIQMFGDVVAEVDKDHFESALSAMKAARGVAQDVDLTAEDLRELVATFEDIYREHKGKPFPQEPRAQLDAAVRAVFESWDNRRARDYRRLNRIPHDLGTAVNVQQMVFGNTGPRSGTGVAFTRSNVTGEKGEPFGDFLINAQGEDVVAGIRTPRPLAELADELPEAYAQLIETMELLERTYHNMQDVEFTIEDGALYMLQTRNGKRSAQAMARIAVDMVDEGIVTEQESLTALVDPDQIHQLLLPQLDQASAPAPLATGVNASPGAAAGAIVFTADEAEARGKAGEQVILVRDETTPDDFHGMVEAQGILTARGGKTSHAAIVAVGMGKPAVCGVTEIRFGEDGTIAIGDAVFAEGDRLTIDGTAGSVFAGDAPLLPPDPNNPYLLRIIEWADRARTMKVRTNADTPEDAVRAREFGAEGIGLCRTEHMFQGEDRLPIVQRMILAGDDEARAE
jgi:pyruvate, orthophosphate dikinase